MGLLGACPSADDVLSCGPSPARRWPSGWSRSRAAARRRNRDTCGAEEERRGYRDRHIQLVDDGQALVRQ